MKVSAIIGYILFVGVSVSQDVTLTTVSQTSTVSLSTPSPTNTASDPRCLPGCVWDRDSLKMSSMSLFPSQCTTVCAKTTIDIDRKCDMTEQQLNDTLRNMKHLIGGLTIRETKLKSAQFLANLESIDCSANSSPEFCITHQEMANLITYDYVQLWNIAGQFCPISSSIATSEKKTCDLQNSTWSGTYTDCVNVLGDVIIDGNNEQYAGNLASVENIFGSLTINETSLRSVNFLGSLQRIISLTEDRRALTVEGNTLMTNVTLPSIEKVYARSFTSIQFDNNSLELVKDPSICYGIRNSITLWHYRIVLFDDKSCEEVERYADTLKSSKRNFLNPILIVLIFVGAVISS